MFTKSYLYTIATKEEVAGHLLSKHNIHFNLTLMRNVQKAIADGTLETFARKFVDDWFKDQERPDWADYALELAFGKKEAPAAQS